MHKNISRLSQIYDIRKSRCQRRYQQACSDSQKQQYIINGCIKKRQEYKNLLIDSSCLSSISIADKAYFDGVLSRLVKRVSLLEEQLVTEHERYKTLRDKQNAAQKNLAKSIYKIELIVPAIDKHYK